LKRADALDRTGGRQPCPLQQELPREQRSVQLAQSEDAFGYSTVVTTS
jgi:hypothetical protein